MLCRTRFRSPSTKYLDHRPRIDLTVYIYVELNQSISRGQELRSISVHVRSGYPATGKLVNQYYLCHGDCTEPEGGRTEVQSTACMIPAAVQINVGTLKATRINCRQTGRRQRETTAVQSQAKIMMTHKLRKKAYNVQGVQDSALNASFGREVTVQQVALVRHPATDCKPRLDTRRKSMKIATWNVRTLYQEGKIENVIKEMDRMSLNIVGLAETRWTGAAVAKVDNKVFIFSGGSTHERGVGILFDESIEKSLKSWCPVSDRVVVAKFAGKPLNMGIVQVYASTSQQKRKKLNNSMKI